MSIKQTMHVILKSSLAKGAWSFRSGSNQTKIDESIHRLARKFGVRLIRYSNNFNHLHLHVKFGSRELYKRFVRALSGQIAMAITGASKAHPISKLIEARFGEHEKVSKTFWDARPFSRIIRGWRGFKTANDYIRLNQLEAEEILPYREERLRGVKPNEQIHFKERSVRRERNTDSQITFFDL